MNLDVETANIPMTLSFEREYVQFFQKDSTLIVLEQNDVEQSNTLALSKISCSHHLWHYITSCFNFGFD
jgi:hypothetical protein